MKRVVGLGIILLILIGVGVVYSYISKNASIKTTPKEIAEEWIKTKSPTYTFDGSNLTYENSKETPDGISHITFHFDSSRAGYGDRTNSASATVITPHIIVVGVKERVVVNAITDEKFDELNNKPIVGKDENKDSKTVSLYFYKLEDDLNDEGNVLCSAEAVVPTERTIENYSIKKHLETLLQGPTAEEKSKGFSSEFPLEGVTIEDATLSDPDGTLTITLNDPNNKTVGGSCRITIIVNQVIKTALSIPGVKTVEILPEDLFQP